MRCGRAAPKDDAVSIWARESDKFVDYLLRQGGAIARAEEFVAGAGDGEQVGGRGNQLECGHNFGVGREAIAHAVDEACRSRQIREVTGAELGGTLRRMKRKGKQEQRVGNGPI